MVLTTFNEVRHHVNKKWQVTAEVYSELPKEKGKITPFMVDHIVKHIDKCKGRIAGVCEKFDHTSEFDTDTLKKETAKLLVNVIMLSLELGMTSRELFEIVPENMKSK